MFKVGATLGTSVGDRSCASYVRRSGEELGLTPSCIEGLLRYVYCNPYLALATLGYKVEDVS